MTTSKLQFRAATPDDAPQLQPLIKSAYRGEKIKKAWTSEGHLVADDRIDVQGIIAKISTPDSAILIAADDDGALVACCEVAKLSEGVGYFGLFAVDPARQGGGLGRQVLAYAEEYVRRTWSVETMELNVIWTREEVIAWYLRRGYKRTGRTNPFPYHELVNGKALRDDLYFTILEKDLTSLPVAPADS
ncbi:hypothetical protein VUR80DRAFT_6045 [Thermomyces stellatus]